MGTPIVIAHRGASGYEPENTLRAVKHALKLGANAIEIDVRRSKDGEIVVIHDETVDRTTNGTGRVVELKLAEIERLDAGSGEQIPTLAEVIALTKDRATLVIEIKVPGLWRPVLEMIQATGMLKQIICVSFIIEEIIELKKTEPNLICGILFRGNPSQALQMAPFVRADIVGFREDRISRELVEHAHQGGFKVLAWTVDDPDRASFLSGLGLDYLASNVPDRIILRLEKISP